MSQIQLLVNGLTATAFANDDWDARSYEVFVQNGVLDPKIQRKIVSRYRDLQERFDICYRDVAASAGLKDLLNQSIPGVVYGGGFYQGQFNFSVINPFGRNLSAEEVNNYSKLVFFGQDQWRSSLSKPDVGAEYNPQINSFLIPGFEFKSPVTRDALVFHELKHHQQFLAQVAKYGEKVAQQAALTGNLATKQEVEATRLAGEILNSGTNGQFRSRLNEIVKAKKAHDPVDLIFRLKVEDMQYLNQLFEKAGPLETGFRHFNFGLDLGITWIYVNVPKEKQEEAINTFYDTLTQANPKPQ